MRLLHLRDDYDGRFAPAQEPQPIRGRNLAFHGRQHMSLWNTSTNSGCDPKGSEGPESVHEGVQPMSGKPDFQIPLEPERYELTAPAAYCFEVDRREFFKFLGAGRSPVITMQFFRYHSGPRLRVANGCLGARELVFLNTPPMTRFSHGSGYEPKCEWKPPRR